MHCIKNINKINKIGLPVKIYTIFERYTKELFVV